MPLELSSHKYQILQSASDYCPVKLYIEGFVEIKMNWHQEKINKFDYF